MSIHLLWHIELQPLFYGHLILEDLEQLILKWFGAGRAVIMDDRPRLVGPDRKGMVNDSETRLPGVELCRCSVHGPPGAQGVGV